MRARHRFLFASVLIQSAVALVATATVAQDATNPNIRFGMPSPAKKDSDHREDYLISRPQYMLEGNAGAGIPAPALRR